MGTLRNNSKYVQRDWVNNETPLNAKNLNNLEQGISEIKNVLADYEGDLDGEKGAQVLNTALDDNNEKQKNQALGKYSTAAGFGTEANNEAEFVIGKYNHSVEGGLFVVGSGPSNTQRENAFEVTSEQITAKKPTTINATLDVTGYTTLVDVSVKDLKASGNVDITGTLNVKGQTTLGQTEASSLKVNGATSLGSDVSDQVLIKGTLTAEEEATFSKEVTITGDLDAGNASFANVDLVANEGELTIPTYTAPEGETLNDNLAVNHGTLNTVKTELQDQLDAHDQRITDNTADIKAIKFFFEDAEGDPLGELDNETILDRLSEIQSEITKDNEWQGSVDTTLGSHAESILDIYDTKANKINNPDGTQEDLSDVKDYATEIDRNAQDAITNVQKDLTEAKTELVTYVDEQVSPINNAILKKANIIEGSFEELVGPFSSHEEATSAGVQSFTYTLKSDTEKLHIETYGSLDLLEILGLAEYDISNPDFNTPIEGELKDVISITLPDSYEQSYPDIKDYWKAGQVITINILDDITTYIYSKEPDIDLIDVYQETLKIENINNSIGNINKSLGELPKTYLEKHFETNSTVIAELEQSDVSQDSTIVRTSNVRIYPGSYYRIHNPYPYVIQTATIKSTSGTNLSDYFDIKGNLTQFPSDYSNTETGGYVSVTFEFVIETPDEDYSNQPITITEHIYRDITSKEIYDSLVTVTDLLSITLEDIDEICGTTITVASSSEVTF